MSALQMKRIGLLKEIKMSVPVERLWKSHEDQRNKRDLLN